MLLVVSTLQTTAAAMVFGQEKVMVMAMTSHMTAEQQAHCQEMMEHDSVSMTLECSTDCECCSGVCSTSPLFIDFHYQAFITSNGIQPLSTVINQPQTSITSLYRPPIAN